MPKPFLPPQGGEKWLCLGMFLTLMFSVTCIVVAIYCIVIIYDPSLKEIYSTISSEPKRCTTTIVERNITGTPEDQKCNWSSCEEWCLSKGASPCSKVSLTHPPCKPSITFIMCHVSFINIYLRDFFKSKNLSFSKNFPRFDLAYFLCQLPHTYV